MSYNFYMIIFDSSTLILLARADILDLFLDSFDDSIVIPEMVRLELTTAGKEDTRSILRHIEGKRISVVRVKNTALVKKLMDDLSIDVGEAEALVLAIERKAGILATDDRNAIRACKILKLEFITAISVLIRAVEKGLLDREEGLAKLSRLQSIGRYGKAIIDDAARKIEGGK